VGTGFKSADNSERNGLWSAFTAGISEKGVKDLFRGDKPLLSSVCLVSCSFVMLFVIFTALGSSKTITECFRYSLAGHEIEVDDSRGRC
jgi:hypothetical protein